MAIKDPSKEVIYFLKDVEGIVEANSAESSYIYMWSKKFDFAYEDLGSGFLVMVGMVGVIKSDKDDIDQCPIMISIFKTKINGKIILRWYATSSFVDYDMIDEWINKYLPGIPKTDALNFSNLLR